MSEEAPLQIFDGHNDVLLRLLRRGEPASAFLERQPRGHLDLPRAREGGFAGGLFAAFTPSPAGEVAPDGTGPRTVTPPTLAQAQAATLAMAARLRRLARDSEGAIEICADVAAIRRCLDQGILATIFHIEGAEAIDPELDALEVLHAAGLRSLGPVWSRSNIFGHGVPFRYPSSPDTGPGLTDAGRALVRACNELGILIDLSHLNEQGFWDVAKLTKAPLVASHSNAHALCGCSRNLTDAQLDAIRETGGLVGLNLAVCFLRQDGANDADTPLDTVATMLDYLVEHVGIEGVGFGTDFDGCLVPRDIADAAGLPRLVAVLRARGWDEPALRKLGHENWLRVLERTWHD